jgi:hypothetical protein
MKALMDLQVERIPGYLPGVDDVRKEFAWRTE